MPWWLRRLSRINEHVINAALAILIGFVGGVGAIAFRFMIKFFQALFYHDTRDFLLFYHKVSPWAKLFLPALGGLIVGPIIFFWVREAKGHGVPEIMEALVVRGGRLRPRLTFFQMLVSAICIGSGSSVGREGPIVMIGSSAGSAVGQLLRAPEERLRTFVGCGAAAGIAATFNAPIAGVLFAVEILLNDFRLEKFSPIVLSSVVATAVARKYYGDFPALQAPPYHLVSLQEFVFYGFLGIAAGLAAVLFIQVLYWCEDFFDRLPFPEYLKPVLGGLIMGLFLLKIPHLFGVGYGAVNRALHGELPARLLLLLIFAKILATSIVLGSGHSGGVFAPSLFIGAMTGGLVGWIVHSMFPALTASPGAYALVGMGAVVAAATHGPITAILIIFELTGDYSIILPLMLSCIVSTFVSTFLKEGSIYTIKLLRRGLTLRRGWEQSVLAGTLVKEVMDSHFQTVPEDASLSRVIEALGRSPHSYLLVVDERGELSGIISFHDVRLALLKGREEAARLTAGDIATREVITITPEDTLLEAQHRLARLGVSQLPVVDPRNPRRIVGMISMRDILSFHERALLKHL
ncbi:chloride channel protein [Thermosulfurimonas sp. F29]|uniref:chloride channel protein n=1 Tax=Thermosulfurimonas sp. F29 TaxID=2867247 RepID=UPI001C837480|nr:chloride channel protein [Thermosulfurimonas sp. F29]MBX6422711.1 chloride channel protein [Thermosulfurimonas sp. F29]